MTKWMRMMKERTEKLKRYAIDRNILEKLTFDFNLNK
jgi:hypothetical protein